MMKNKSGSGAWIMGIAGIGAAIFGIIWTSEANSMTRNSPFGNGPSLIMTAGGILFVVMALLIAVHSFRHGGEEEQAPGEDPADRNAEEKLISRISQAVKENQAPREKARWSCPYCGTMVSDDAAFCPGCGAGRKKAGS